MLANDESDRRWTAFINACRRLKHLLVVEVAEIHLLETHDKMDEMAEWMVPMSTGQSSHTSSETFAKTPSAGPA